MGEMYDCSGWCLYVRCSNGKFIAMDKIPVINSITDSDEKYNSHMNFSTDAVISIVMTHRSARMVRKMAIKAKNQIARRKRKYYRMKEKHRRILLKASGKPQTVFWKGNANEN